MKIFKNKGFICTLSTLVIFLILNIIWIIKDIETYICVGCVAWIPTLMTIKFIIDDIQYYKIQEEK